MTAADGQRAPATAADGQRAPATAAEVADGSEGLAVAGRPDDPSRCRRVAGREWRLVAGFGRRSRACPSSSHLRRTARGLTVAGMDWELVAVVAAVAELQTP
jgi:hypothetical protein